MVVLQAKRRASGLYEDLETDGAGQLRTIGALTGSVTLSTTQFAVTGSTITIPVTGSFGVTTPIGVTGSSVGLSTPVGLTGSGITGSIILTSPVGVTGSSVGINTPIGITGSNVTLAATGSIPATLLYGFANFVVDTGSYKATGSVTAIDVSQYTTKSVYAYIDPLNNVLGALIVSGSFDGVNWYTLRSGSFYSGSTTWFTLYDAVPQIKAFLFFNAVTGSAATGSLFITAQR